MKAFTLIALVALIALANATIDNFIPNLGAGPGAAITGDSLYVKPSTGLTGNVFTLTPSCDGTVTDCSATPSWSSVPDIFITSAGTTTGTATTTVGITLQVDVTQLGSVNRFIVSYTAGTTPVTRKLVVYVTEGTIYTAFPSDLKPQWKATLVNGYPRNKQRAPVQGTPSSVGAPLSFAATPATPDVVPLYWGNYFEVRVGLTNAGTWDATTLGSYCGATGVWTGSTGANNGNDVPPAVKNNGVDGCDRYLEANDVWVFPAPKQRVPYSTIASQVGPNDFYDGPLVFTVRGTTGSSLVFNGQSYSASSWLSSCVPADLNTVGTQANFPCNFPRTNPDPQVWVITASKSQPTRFTGITTSSVTAPVATLNYQATPKLLLSDLEKTNDFTISLEWVAQLSSAATSTSPALTATTVADVPNCYGTAFVGDDGSAPIIGVGRFPTCVQGLATSNCTGVFTNCILASAALTNGADFGTNNVQDGILKTVFVAQKPLALRPPSIAAATLNPTTGSLAHATYEATVGGRSGAFTIGFPQLSYPGGATIDTFYWNTVANDTSLTVTPRFVYECAPGGVSPCIPPTTGGALPNYVNGSLSTFFVNRPVPSVNISSSTPVATFTFDNLPFPTSAGANWVMFFDVVDAVTKVTPAGYSWSAMPALDIIVDPIKATFVNFPPADGKIYITQDVASAGSAAYIYELRIEKSPAELNVAEIRLTFNLPSSDPIKIFVAGAPINSGGTGAFVFTGTQRVIHFQVIATAEVTAPFSITFVAPAIAFFANPADLTGLTVVKNPINVKLPDSTAAGPFVREEFSIEFTWSPPATSAFTITIASEGLEQGTVNVPVNIGDTGVIAQNLTAKPSQAISPSSASITLALAFTTSSSAYSLPVSALVNVYRHSFVVTNANNDASHLVVYASGQKSHEYCISTNYPVFSSSYTTSTDSVIINFAALDQLDKVIPGVIVEPSSNSTGGVNFLTLNKANNGHGCVTIRADRLFNWDALGLPAVPGEWFFTLNTYLAGSLANMFQNPTAFDIAGTKDIWNFPHNVTVQRLSINFIKPVSSLVSGMADTFALGETVTAFAYVDVLPPAGLSYQLKATPAVTITPSSANLAAGAQGINGQWHAWDITFDTSIAGGNTYAGLSGATPLTIDFALYVAGADATFYRSTDPSAAVDDIEVVYTATLVKRSVQITVPEAPLTVQVGSSLDAVQIALNHPVVNGLTVKLVAHNTNGVPSTGLTFDPASVAFTPSSPNAAVITVTGNLIGEYSFGYELSGPDAEWFSVDTSPYADWNLVNVTQRTAAGLLGTTTIYAGVTYGPFAISFDSPLAPGETVTITPSGSDFTFTPASFTLQPGQMQAPFSFVFKPQAQVSKAYVFWRVSGASAWKYQLPAGGRQEFDVLYLSASVVLQGKDSVIPGVAHEGYVTLPFPASVTVTPAIVGAAVTFSPSTFVFTPATGNVIHFTYTVSATQTFGLASANVPVVTAKRDPSGVANPDTTGTAFAISFSFTGTDAALFDAGSVVTVSVVRPKFLLDATYSSGGGVVLNSVEQDTSIFVVGKFSPMYSIHLASPPASGPVTLTITDTKNVVEFEFLSGGAVTRASTATLTFTADNYLQYFRFRFVNLLSEDLSFVGVEHLSVTVSQPFYDYTAIFGAFDGLTVVPALAFSPIPAIYTDGMAKGLFAAVKDKDGVIGKSWPYDTDAQFTLHIIPEAGLAGSVVVEPSTIEFSKSSLSDPVQGFNIRHTNPRNFDGIRSYKLYYLVRFAGSSHTVNITTVVPQDAQNVLLARYQVIPKFPHVLSYGWQKASFNISFTPVAHVSFIPRLPPVDGDFSVQGARAAGRVDFEPAVIVAAPGQQVVDFKVKAQPGVDRDSLYYRVDWEVIGHKDDLVNLVESLQVGAQGLANSDKIHFATWHLASAGVTSVSFALVAIACAIAVARNMF